MNLLIAVFTLPILLAFGCSNVKTEKSTPSKPSYSRIIGGELTSEKHLAAPSTVGIYDLENEFICTGTLLTEHIIVTAAHCIETKPEKIRLVFGLQLFETLNAREVDIQEEFVRRAQATRRHPQWNKQTTENTSTVETEWHDLALILFKGSLPEGYHPATRLADAALLTEGNRVIMAGYGATHVKITNVNEKKYPNLKKAIESGELECEEDETTQKLKCYKIDFEGDDELFHTAATIRSISSTEVRLDESHGHGTCVGDSGGPAFIEHQGELLFFGVTSRGSFACDNTGVYTNTLAFKDWIDQTIIELTQGLK
ncbi:MAG: hypothetical protein A2622_13380 [Bdellovibrionales bacterium RIFCSPHIGHO2_01_FULL_40_29]|nr:MAG: hypothetical protein A2622_13380 [Bdellovibrionales bacterium RIFCSPHIGHO2_01_FULL_40_29]OFZ34311.1 MAG: hypothetical protein A3D17_04570 [Bdellovibrionales bacterium RIFCSPHIGHO2_02_FULL_40_15]